MPGLVADAVRAYGSRISASDREVIAESIRQNEQYGWGDACDIQTWSDLLEWLHEEEPAP